MTIKGVVGIALLTVSVLSFVVFVVSYAVQPSLPSFANSALWLFGVVLTAVLGGLAAFNDIIELVQKLRGDRYKEPQPILAQELNEHALSIYPHRNPPYNAAKMLYTGSEVAKDLYVTIVYKDGTGETKTKVVTDFFPKEDPRMWQYYYKYDFLEPNQVTYFHLLQHKSTSDGKATVVVTFTGATSGKTIQVRREFELEKF